MHAVRAGKGVDEFVEGVRGMGEGEGEGERNGVSTIAISLRTNTECT